MDCVLLPISCLPRAYPLPLCFISSVCRSLASTYTLPTSCQRSTVPFPTCPARSTALIPICPEKISLFSVCTSLTSVSPTSLLCASPYPLSSSPYPHLNFSVLFVPSFPLSSSSYPLLSLPVLSYPYRQSVILCSTLPLHPLPEPSYLLFASPCSLSALLSHCAPHILCLHHPFLCQHLSIFFLHLPILSLYLLSLCLCLSLLFLHFSIICLQLTI